MTHFLVMPDEGLFLYPSKIENEPSPFGDYLPMEKAFVWNILPSQSPEKHDWFLKLNQILAPATENILKIFFNQVFK